MAYNPFYVQPGNDFSQGLSGLSNTLQDLRKERQREALVQQELDARQKAEARYQEASTLAQEAFKSGEPSKIAEVSLQYPEIADALKMSAGLQTDLQNQAALGFTRSLALAAPEERPALYERRIQEIRDRGGDPSHTEQSYKDYLANPEAETRAVISYWAGIDPKGYQAFADEQAAAQKERLAQQRLEREDARFMMSEQNADRRAAMRAGMTSSGMKPTAGMQDFQYYQNLKKEDPQAAEEFGRERGFISKEGTELSSHLQKRLSVATDDAIKAENDIGRFEALANEIEQADFGGGLIGSTWAEAAKEATGTQDTVSGLRRQFNAIRASQVVNNLPPGAASDADIALALSGFPSDKANKQQVTGFLRGLAKLQRVNAEFNNYKAEYISDNGSERGMLQSWKSRGDQPQAAQPGAPQVGQVLDGYRFLGGDPSNPASWEQQ